MKNKFLFFVISILSLVFSCQNQIDKNELTGIWELYYAHSNDTQIYQFEIKSDKVIFSDEFNFSQESTFELDSRKLRFKDRNGKQTEIRIARIELDSIMTKDSLFYMRNRKSSQSHSYSLIGTNSKDTLDNNAFFPFIHYYEYKGIVKLKIGNKFYEVDDLFAFTERISRHEDFTIFLGSEVKLLSLKKLYAYLNYLGWKKVNIVTKYTKSEQYQYRRDNINIWRSEMYELLKSPLPPPHPEIENKYESKEEFVKVNNAKIIEINNLRDTSKFGEISTDLNYLVNINKQIALKDYFTIKRKMASEFEMKRQKLMYEIE